MICKLTSILRHYSYECKATIQDRPYVSRPSRSQQLANPKLVPQLNSDIPNELLRKNGIADEELAKIAEERGRKRSREDEDASPPPQRKRSRSASSYSSSSVSTISTNHSRSLSRDIEDTYMTSQRTDFLPAKPQNGYGKRRRSRSSSVDSYTSYNSRDEKREKDSDRNTRRRMSSYSPGARGRRRSRSLTSNVRHRVHYRSRSPYRATTRHNDAPRGIGKRVSSPKRRDGRPRSRMRFRSGSRSPYRPRGSSRSTTPVHRSKDTNQDRSIAPNIHQRQNPSAKPKERSLSPFSKRLALTQAMNMER
ncbi:hypothetical protein M501DRAFT_1001545 [Patellaria atrata CBS 101060]|uniref:Zinc knuckle-domain-containing protein n=1 Tax=Patellaria atrata CBS 101060 TaxID=1346257 RepID=A0A9P4VT55_9PEZI|nr:hypothetical protein M501DRAFT_1001545 [Patellaria atrata CBS 101060]